MEPNQPLSSPIHITTIEEVIRIVFKENDLTRDRRNEEAVDGLLREHGYVVESGNQVGGTAYRTLIVRLPERSPNIAYVAELLKSRPDLFEVNAIIHPPTPGANEPAD
jgi:hypothetical protein